MTPNHSLPTRECASVAALLPLAAHGLLSEQEAARLQAHLETCAYCQAEAALDTQLETALRRSYAPPEYSSPLWPREQIMALLSADNAHAALQAALAPAAQEVQSAPPVVPGTSGRSARRVSGLAALAVTLAVIVLAVALFGIPGLLPGPHGAAPIAPRPLSIFVSQAGYAGSVDPYSVTALDASTGKPRWRYQVNDSPQPQPFLFENVVYFGASKGTVTALDASTGKRLWSVALSSAGFPVVQAAKNGLIYVIFQDCLTDVDINCPSPQGGPLYALNASDGKIAWQSLEQLTVAQATPDALFVTSGLTLYALNPATGAERWHFNAAGPAGTTQGYIDSVQIINGQVYPVAIFLNNAGLAGTGFYDLNPGDGIPVWSHSIFDEPGSLFFAGVENGVIYFTGSSQPPTDPQEGIGVQDEVLAFNTSNGSLKWRSQQKGLNAVNSIVVKQGIVYVAGDNGTLYALSEQDGSLLWQKLLSGAGFHIDVGDDDNLYVIFYDSQHLRQNILLALSDKDGATLWTFFRATFAPEKSSASVLAVIHGVLYGVVSDQPGEGAVSYVFALNTADGTLRWSYDIGQTPITPVIG